MAVCMDELTHINEFWMDVQHIDGWMYMDAWMDSIWMDVYEWYMDGSIDG